MERYGNRQEAGIRLAQELEEYADRKDVLVLALPRGGVPVAFEVAKLLHVPLDVFIVRKLGVPGHRELAMGALAMGGITFFNEDIIRECHVQTSEIQRVIAEEQQELERREKLYRANFTPPDFTGKTIILIDDGIATGATMHVAIMALRHAHPAAIIVAVPVGEESLVESFQPLADKLICPLQPSSLVAVGKWYEDFEQTEDEEVHQLLRKAQQFSLVGNSHA